MTIAKAVIIEKKYARRENTITVAPSRTLLQCAEMKLAWNDQFTQQSQAQTASMLRLAGLQITHCRSRGSLVGAKGG
jgi:hypothetical protein